MKQQSILIGAVAIGGGLGSSLRYGIHMMSPLTHGPLGTIIVNLIASFLLGALVGAVLNRSFPEWLRAGFGVGFCGGLSTMSAFAADGVFLITDQHLVFAGVYMIVSLVGGICFSFCGLVCGQKWAGGANQ
ncbi:CrcB family protein [Geomicrobium sp. JSM 1781026]|uniref:fluoride efflux transporter FluC n=1 Tax=Geomicrobium sp. JSM 1781026 TaxID=3344580 RepID=UPI0035C0534C